jgi:hypothetical protein
MTDSNLNVIPDHDYAAALETNSLSYNNFLGYPGPTPVGQLQEVLDGYPSVFKIRPRLFSVRIAKLSNISKLRNIL